MSRFVCLMYHNVVRSSPNDAGPYQHLSPSVTSYFVTADQFREQVGLVPRDRWLDPADLRHADFWRDSHDESGKPRVLLTFDDGWLGSFEETAPLLKQHGARAIVFVTTGFIGQPLFCDREVLANAPADTFEIGAHTITHPFLNELPDDTIRRELSDSRRQLEDILGRAVTSVSIPNGAIDTRVRHIAEDVGYQLVFTSDVHFNDSSTGALRIGRVALRSNTSLAQFRRWIDGDIQGAGWRARALSIPKQLLGPVRYRRLRSWGLREHPDHNEMAALLNPALAAASQRLSASPQ